MAVLNPDSNFVLKYKSKTILTKSGIKMFVILNYISDTEKS